MNAPVLRLFIDMDGTLAEWRDIKINLRKYEEAADPGPLIYRMLNTPGYYRTLLPYKNVVKAVSILAKEHIVDIYILSCYLQNGLALQEKDAWLDEYLPEIDKAHRIFVPDGSPKAAYVPGGFRKTDFLLDDYTKNLKMWPDHTKAIKLLNDVNSSNETWKGSRISYDADPEEIVQHIYSITQVGSLIRDKNPEKGTRPVGHEEVLNILADYILEQGKEDNEKEL